MLKDFLEGKPLRHPLHPLLVHFPIGLFILSLLLDLASFAFRSTPDLVRGAFYAMLLGIIMALIAAVPGFVDYTDIRGASCFCLYLDIWAAALFMRKALASAVINGERQHQCRRCILRRVKTASSLLFRFRRRNASAKRKLCACKLMVR